MQKKQEKKECVKVVVRCRPMSKGQQQNKNIKIVHINNQKRQIIVKKQSEPEKQYNFDLAFNPQTSQKQGFIILSVYQEGALPTIESVLEGYNGTIFAYGQTGTGKTFTMQGKFEDEQLRGIIPRTFNHIFKVIQGTPGIQFLVRSSMIQLYNQQIVDLLSSNIQKKLELHQNPEKGIFIKGLQFFPVKSAKEMEQKLVYGSHHRHTASTNMNKESSRSHSIFVINVQMAQALQNGQQKVRVGKLNLVDLAGSQKLKKTGTTKQRSKEGICINLALTTLGHVIKSLTDPNCTHVPFRDSKLTRLLQDSLGGNTKTVMIANIGPADYNYQQTINTLRYAERAKRIKLRPKINQDPKDTMIREYQDQISRLKEMLKTKGSPHYIPGETKVIEVQKIVNMNDEFQIQKIQAKIQAQKQKLKQASVEEKQKLEQQLKKDEIAKKNLIKQLEQKKSKKKTIVEDEEKIKQQLKKLQNQIQTGDKLKAVARQNEKKILHARMQLQQRKQQQNRRRQQLQRQDIKLLQVQVKYNSLKEQIEAKNKILKQQIRRVKQVKQQVNQIHQTRTAEREQIQQQNRQIIQQLKLMNLIIQHFIPPSQLKRLKQRLDYSQQVDDWIIKDVQMAVPRPPSALGLKVPMCQYSRMAVSLGDKNPRFRPDNITQIDLDEPDQTTQQFDAINLQPSPAVGQTMEIVLTQDEEQYKLIMSSKQPDVYIDDPQLLSKQNIQKKQQNEARLRSAKRTPKRPPSSRRL